MSHGRCQVQIKTGPGKVDEKRTYQEEVSRRKTAEKNKRRKRREEGRYTIILVVNLANKKGSSMKMTHLFRSWQALRQI